MIQDGNLDVRTITMGISLLDCMDSGVDVTCEEGRARYCVSSAVIAFRCKIR